MAELLWRCLTRKKISATHAEYSSHITEKDENLGFYKKRTYNLLPSYIDMFAININPKQEKKTLIDILPANVEYKTLKLIEEVKRAQPIPWIKEFEDIV